ncbi:acetyltransferase [Leptolyngbya ohadii]|uniref:acetyltransferase n=1 Tax=Leptolyngbya ohadii TaxID=1962290 RepID=UPI000B59CC37|nr:acetyltransferase [Leptolyngbya ohadii]
MLLQDKQTGVLVEVMDTEELINPMRDKIKGRVQEGQEEQLPEEIGKDTLIFPSGEELPRCWRDADYRSA